MLWLLFLNVRRDECVFILVVVAVVLSRPTEFAELVELTLANDLLTLVFGFIIVGVVEDSSRGDEANDELLLVGMLTLVNDDVDKDFSLVGEHTDDDEDD